MHPLVAKTLEIAAGTVGVREKPIGSNRGVEVSRYLRSVGLGPGQPWCCAFVYYCAHTAAEAMGVGNPFLRTGYCPYVSGWARDEHILFMQAQPGDAFLRYGKTKQGFRAHHIGLVSSVTATQFETIEGNAQPLTSNVLTPWGWKRMGDLELGDVLVDPEGGTSEVIGVWPRGRQSVYRLTMMDGSSAEASADHLWAVYRHDRRTDLRLLTTRGIQERVEQGLRVSLPEIQECHFEPTRHLEMDPYLLGVLVGDGSLSRAPVHLTSADEHIVSEVRRVLPIGCELVPHCMGASRRREMWRFRGADRYGRPQPQTMLDDLGLFGSRSWNKSIPKDYLWSPAPARLALLQGLMDTDGSVDPVGRMEFCSVSEVLAADVQHLVRSLGGKVAVYKKTGITYTSPNQLTPKGARDAYVLRNIRFRNGTVPFRLPRKAERVQERHRVSGWAVKSVEYVREDEVQCITVSAPSGLYITDDFIPTHNSNPSGGSEGIGVFRLRRTLGSQYRFVRWGQLIPSEQVPVYKLLIGGREVDQMPIQQGKALANVKRFAQALGVEIGWSQAAQAVLLGGKEVPAQVSLIGNEAHIPIRELVAFVGLQLRVNAAARIVEVFRG